MSIAKVVIPTGLLNVVGNTINIQDIPKGANAEKQAFNHDILDSIVVVAHGRKAIVQEAWKFYVGRDLKNPFGGAQVFVKFKSMLGEMVHHPIPNAHSFTVEPNGFKLYNRNGSLINTSGNAVKKEASGLVTDFNRTAFYEGYVEGRVLYISQKGIDACQASKAGQVRCWVSPSEYLTFTFK
jgi:hypothetical protein